MPFTGKGLMQTSLLPVLPGAAHAAAAFIAQRRAANNAISRTGACVWNMSDGPYNHTCDNLVATCAPNRAGTDTDRHSTDQTPHLQLGAPLRSSTFDSLQQHNFFFAAALATWCSSVQQHVQLHMQLCATARLTPCSSTGVFLQQHLRLHAMLFLVRACALPTSAEPAVCQGIFEDGF
eukprot:scaffold230427_cov20-Tisochrysis_lutea.AAC.1